MSFFGFTRAKNESCFQKLGSNVFFRDAFEISFLAEALQFTNRTELDVSTFQFPKSALTVGYWLVKSVWITGTGVFLIRHSARPLPERHVALRRLDQEPDFV